MNVSTFQLLLTAYEYHVLFDEKSMKTCKVGDEKKDKIEHDSFSKCKRRCDDDATCRFMRYSKADNWCFTFVQCKEYQDDSDGITYYKDGEFEINHGLQNHISMDLKPSNIKFILLVMSHDQPLKADGPWIIKHYNEPKNLKGDSIIS